MDVEVKIDPNQVSPKIVVITSQMTEEVLDLVRQLSNNDSKNLLGYADEQIIPLPAADIDRIYADGQKVIAEAAGRKLQVRQRLYELEQKFEGTPIIRISNSELVNFSKVESLDLSLGGTITLKLKNNGRAYVSRRYIEKIKNYLGI